MVRSDREGVGLERWEKWDEAEMKFFSEEMRFIIECEVGQKPYLDSHLNNSRFSVGEVVRDRFNKHRGVVMSLFAKTGLYVMFPQYDTPQLVRSVNMEKIDD